MSERVKSTSAGYSRRSFLGGTASTMAVPFVAETLPQNAQAEARADKAPDARRTVSLDINGQIRQLSLDPRTTLLDALREHIGLTGTKKGCDQGQCGACTVHVDGRNVLSCLTLAAAVEGRQITTIEGLAKSTGELHPVQQAFLDQDAFQCGYCTPGQIMSAVACIASGRADTPNEIREFMSGNLCRCAAYPNIVAAIQEAKEIMEG